jgi:hypothetical protein
LLNFIACKFIILFSFVSITFNNSVPLVTNLLLDSYMNLPFEEMHLMIQ